MMAFVLSCADAAFGRAVPQIITSDQGSHFTSDQGSHFTSDQGSHFTSDQGSHFTSDQGSHFTAATSPASGTRAASWRRERRSRWTGAMWTTS